MGFPGGLGGNQSACNMETQIWSLVWWDPLEKGATNHLSILALRIPQTEEPGGYSPWGCRVRHDWVTNTTKIAWKSHTKLVLILTCKAWFYNSKSTWHWNDKPINNRRNCLFLLLTILSTSLIGIWRRMLRCICFKWSVSLRWTHF